MNNLLLVQDALKTNYSVEGGVHRLLPEYSDLEGTVGFIQLVEKVSLKKINEITQSIENEEEAHWYNRSETKIQLSKVSALHSIDRLQLMMIHLVAADMLKPSLGTLVYNGVDGDEADNDTFKILEIVRERISKSGIRDYQRTDVNHVKIATRKFNEWFLSYADDKDLALMGPWVKEDIQRLKKFNSLVMSS